MAVSVPDTPKQPDQVLWCARNFTSMCRGCNTPPGQPAAALTRGLNPSAPELGALLRQRSPVEAFVLIRDGVRMTGMGAFGPSHEAEELWSLVSFLGAMSGSDGDTYESLVREAKQHGAGADGHDHAHSGDGGSDTQAPPGHEGHDHAH